MEFELAKYYTNHSNSLSGLALYIDERELALMKAHNQSI